MMQEAEILPGNGPVDCHLETTTPTRILQHLKTTGLDPNGVDDDRTESVEMTTTTPESFQLRDVEAANKTAPSTITNDDDLGYETDNTVRTNGERDATDEQEEEDVGQLPFDLEVFIEQNSDAAPPPLVGQCLTFHDLEEDELDSEIRHRSERARSQAMAEEAILEVDEINDEVL